MKTKIVQTKAEQNYKESEPWPNDDSWHTYTYNILHKYVQDRLSGLRLNNSQVILNAGCGKTTYNTKAKMVYMDIIKDYVDLFENYLIGSVEQIPLSDNSMDGIICVGSVVNYVDIQKAISEFSRVLKPHGFLIMEYERSNSAEFLFSKDYAKTVFLQKYKYNNQIHYLWMYNEKFVLKLAEYYGLCCMKKYRYHNVSSLLYRLGMKEESAAELSKFDKLTQPFSYPFAHNEILILTKNHS